MNEIHWKKPILWWITLFLKPALFLGAGVLLIVTLGVAQRLGWISAGVGGSGSLPPTVTQEKDVLYICPMMCTPPLSEPGRCPVCGMELVPASSGNSSGDGRSIQIDPASRRVANIHTVAVKSVGASRELRAVGQLSYDEGKLKTLAAYVDGRLDRLYADYIGAVVNQGDNLALLYSPELYTAQTELLAAKRAAQRSRSSLVSGVLDSQDLYGNVRRKLIDLGMTETQIARLEETEQPVTRIELVAPIHGTVIAKLASEGEYVKTGQPIYRLADLSIVWLMLELFPEDAAAIRFGQRVESEVQSLPGEKFTGRVAFVDPMVDPKTRTVGVRVVISNEEGRLKTGDYATATVEIPVRNLGDPLSGFYDPDLAGKWISPRHPHVIEEKPGKCKVCGIELVPASMFGFTDQPVTGGKQLVVPRNAVLMAGRNSVVYVETEPGRFELRHVELGPRLGDEIVLLSGVKEGEYVATSGNFLIDSQMQLAGNPSLIDSTKAQSSTPVDEAVSPEMAAAMAKRSEDESVDEPPANEGLPPIGPIEMIESTGETHAKQPAGTSVPAKKDEADALAEFAHAFSTLPDIDRGLVVRQKTCPVADMPLGSMGPPIKVEVNGTAVFVCCEGCRESLLAEPAKYLAKLRKGTEP